MPERIQLSRRKGWRKPEGAIVVSRPSRWGNHYRVVEHNGTVSDHWTVVSDEGTHATFLSPKEAHTDAVRRFREDAASDLLPGGSVSELVEQLRGHDLCCWCPPKLACHADVLLELANGGDR